MRRTSSKGSDRIKSCNGNTTAVCIHAANHSRFVVHGGWTAHTQRAGGRLEGLPIATRLPAVLELREYGLSLADEGAGNPAKLKGLATQIREAVKPQKFLQL